MYLAEVNATFALKLVEYNNFEAAEGKMVLDTHFAHVSHKLVCWVHIGNDLESGEQLADLLEVRITFLILFKRCEITQSLSPSLTVHKVHILFHIFIYYHKQGLCFFSH